MSAPYNPHLPCELQLGHVWLLEPVLGEDVLGNKIKLYVCANCGKVIHGEVPNGEASIRRD